MAGGDRIKENATVSGTGDITLTGAMAGYRAFSSTFTNGQLCTYEVYNTTDDTWEIGVGTYNSGPNTITRTTLKSSSTGSTITFAAGSKFCFNTVCAEEFSTTGATNSIPCTTSGSALDISWIPTVTLSKGGTGADLHATGAAHNVLQQTSSGANVTVGRLATNDLSDFTIGGAVTFSGAFTTGITVTANTSITLPTSGTLSTLAGTETLTNKRITLRVDTIATGTTLGPLGDSDDVSSQINTQTAGTLTISAPTGTPTDAQLLCIRIKSTNVQTFSWNAIYLASTDLALPTTSTGTSKWDYVLFIYNSSTTKWDILAKNFGH